MCKPRVDSCGYGFWMEGSGSLTTSIVKNSISNYERGMYFTGGLQLQNQLQYPGTTIPLSHRNEWVGKNSNIGSRPELYTEAGLNMGGTNYYFYSSDPNNNSNNNGAIGNISGPGGSTPFLSNISDATTPLCDDVFATPGGPNQRILSFFVDTTNIHWDSSSIYGFQSKWLSQREVAKSYFTYQDTLSLCLLPNKTNNYINDINTNTTCHKTVLVNKYISENDFSNALIINSSIDGLCTSGSVYKSFNEIAIPYIQAFRNYDTVEVDSDDIINILDIANLCPYQYGEVVNSARTFIKNFVDQNAIFQNACEIINEASRTTEINRN